MELKVMAPKGRRSGEGSEMLMMSLKTDDRKSEQILKKCDVSGGRWKSKYGLWYLIGLQMNDSKEKKVI